MVEKKGKFDIPPSAPPQNSQDTQELREEVDKLFQERRDLLAEGGRAMRESKEIVEEAIFAYLAEQELRQRVADLLDDVISELSAEGAPYAEEYFADEDPERVVENLLRGLQGGGDSDAAFQQQRLNLLAFLATHPLLIKNSLRGKENLPAALAQLRDTILEKGTGRAVYHVSPTAHLREIIGRSQDERRGNLLTAYTALDYKSLYRARGQGEKMYVYIA
ncbi:hypothetical protein D6779_06970, partial [Candidatus Parcubacteria bacterium]